MAESLAPTEVPLVGDFSTSAPNPAFADARVGVVTFPAPWMTVTPHVLSVWLAVPSLSCCTTTLT